MATKHGIMTKVFVQPFSSKHKDVNSIEKKIDRTDIDFYIVPMKGLKHPA